VTGSGANSSPGPYGIANYGFSWGDGTSTGRQSSATATHTYDSAGTYTVTLTLTDNKKHTSTASAQEKVTPAPTPSGSGSSAIAVYAGYFDNHHSYNPQPQPSPFTDASVFVGQPDDPRLGPGWDTATVRIHNQTGSTLSGVAVTVDIGGNHYDLWGSNSIPANGDLVVAQVGFDTFDGSDTNSAGCFGCDPSLCFSAQSSTVPVVHVVLGGQRFDFKDTGQVLNTHGWDSAGCPDPGNGNRSDESEAWLLL
jgi:PKD repeat protein